MDAKRDYPVAVFDPGDAYYNTIVLPGMEIIVPLEEDLDCDPLQDDEVRLQRLDGGFEQIRKASDPEAIPDHEAALIYYHFTDVPAGYYRVSARIGGEWVDVTLDLMLTSKGAHMSGRRLTKDPPPARFDMRQNRPLPKSDLVDDASPLVLPPEMDQSDQFGDEEE